MCVIEVLGGSRMQAPREGDNEIGTVRHAK